MRASMLVLAGMLSACATAQESPLTGTWTATDAVRNGAPALDVVGHHLTFADDSFRIVKPDGALVYGGTYRVDPAAVPPAGVTWAGVELDDTGLVITDNAPDPSRPRPTGFGAPAGSTATSWSSSRRAAEAARRAQQVGWVISPTTLRDVFTSVRVKSSPVNSSARPFRLRHRVRHAVPEVQPRGLPSFPEAQECLDCGAGVRLP